MKIRPSSLPALSQCSTFEADASGNDDTNAGTKRHAALSALLDSTGKLVAPTLESAEAEAVEWAAYYIQNHAPMLDHPLHCERTLTLLSDDFQEIMRGTPDVVCGNHLFDLKWRERDYRAQMAAYALMLMEESGWHEVHVHVLFGERMRAEKFTLPRDEAESLVMGIVGKVKSSLAKPTPCDYCNWCAKKLACPAVQKTVKAVADGYSVLDRVHNWHPSEQTDAEQLSTMLFIARKVLKPWIESVEHHAMESVTKQGLSIPGYELKSKTGRTWIADVSAAFVAAGLPQDVFLKCCDVRMNTSKTYPDKVGIVDEFAKAREMKKAPAKRDLIAKLGAAVQTGKPTQYLAEVGEKEGEE